MYRVEAVTALLRDHPRLVSVLDALDDAIVLVGPDLEILACNAAAATSLRGRPRVVAPGLLESAGFSVIREDGSPWPSGERPVLRAVRDGAVTDRALMGLVRDGLTRWVRVSVRPLDGDPDGLVLGIFAEVTGLEVAARALRESEEHFRLLAENSTDLIQRCSAAGVILYSSPSLLDVLGWSPGEIEGQDIFDYFHPSDVPTARELLGQLVRTGEPQAMRYRARHRDGRWVWLETTARAIPEPDGVVREVQSATRDVGERVESEQRLSRLALADQLTGLANRAALIQRLEELLEAGRQVALLYLDLDRFKVVNDSLGHSAGDELLRVVASRLAGASRDDDVVARLGGDEFVLVAPDLDEQGAVRLAERVQRVLSGPVRLSGHELVVSASVGVVVGGGAGEDEAETLLRDADISMYRAKARGRATAVVWTKEFGAAATARLTLEGQLREAIDGGPGGLRVYYQPQVDLWTGDIVGVEALVRWQHPDRGLLLPGAFLDVADDSGLVVELGRQVLAQSARQVAIWRRLPGCSELGLSVNLSAQELLRPARPKEVLATLDEAGLPVQALTLEVLESVLLDAEGAVSAALAAHAEHGLRLALDDFGTGSSSLLHLRTVPVDVVKVDRAFVAGLGTSCRDEAIVRAVQSLTGDLGLACVAEGVEEPRQREWLARQGVHLAQGFLLHRPLPADGVTAVLAPLAASGSVPGRPE